MVIGTLGILIHVVGWKQLLVISGSVILAIAALIFFVLFIAVWIDGVQRKKDRTGPTLVLFLIDAALWIWLGHIWSLF
jgi:hypothetical protein